MIYRKDDGTVYKDFSSDELNPDYAGDTKVFITRVLWRLNVGALPMEAMLFPLYPLYKDGILLRYIAVSAIYIAIMIPAGCAIVKRRNIN